MLRFCTKNIHQSWLVVAMCVGVVVGTVLALVFRISFFVASLWVWVAVGIMVIGYFWPKTFWLIAAVVAGMILAFYRSSQELNGEEYIRQFYNQTVIVSGRIDGDPETDESGTKIKLMDLKFGEDGVAASGSLYISEYRNENLVRGDNVTLRGKLTEGFGTYVGYMYKPNNWFAERVRGLVSEPQVNLGLSYLLGMKAGLPDDLSENLRTVGLVHIVVASGAHLSILVEIARKIFRKLSRFAGLLFSVLFVVFFMAMVGWTPSIMRAGIMTILTLLAWYVGRKFAPWRIILIVAAGTLLVSPMFIINLGWLLSFASFAGIMILGPRLTKFFYGEKKPGFVAEIIITTLAATLMTLPIILYYYGTVSLISVVANLLILPTLPYAMGLVFLSGAVVGVPFLEMAVGWLATKLLDFHIAVVEFFGGMKSFLIEIEPYQTWVFLIYLVIFVPLVIGLIRQKMVKLREENYHLF